MPFYTWSNLETLQSLISSFVMKYKVWVLLEVCFLTASPLGMQEKPNQFPSTFYFDFTISTSFTVTMESCDSHILVYENLNLLHYDQILYLIVLPSVNTKSKPQGSLTILSHFPECMWIVITWNTSKKSEMYTWLSKKGILFPMQLGKKYSSKIIQKTT